MTKRGKKDDTKLEPVHLTEREAHLLLLACGDRLKHLLVARSGGAITGKELDRRIGWWQGIIHKLNKRLEACNGKK